MLPVTAESRTFPPGEVGVGWVGGSFPRIVLELRGGGRHGLNYGWGIAWVSPP